jgi:hypothetical protein
MFKMTRKAIGSAIAAAALTASLMAPASYAADAQNMGEPMTAGSYTAPRVLDRDSEGWVLDAGGPSVYFERIDE